MVVHPVFVLIVLCFRVIEVIKTYLSPSNSHNYNGPTQHLSLVDVPRKLHKIPIIPSVDKMDGFIASIQLPETTIIIRSSREKANRLQTIVTFRAVIITAVALSEIMMKVSPPIEVTYLLMARHL